MIIKTLLILGMIGFTTALFWTFTGKFGKLKKEYIEHRLINSGKIPGYFEVLAAVWFYIWLRSIWSTFIFVITYLAGVFVYGG